MSECQEIVVRYSSFIKRVSRKNYMPAEVVP